MTVQALFDKERRGRIQDELRRGDVDSLLRRRKPGPDSQKQVLQLGKEETLGDCTFRFTYIEHGHAFVDYEGPVHRPIMPCDIQIGQKRAVKLRTESGDRRFFILEAKNAHGKQGQDAVNVTVSEGTKEDYLNLEDGSWFEPGVDT